MDAYAHALGRIGLQSTKDPLPEKIFIKRSTASNTMLNENDNPVIVDFGSCTPIGCSLEHVGRTYQWLDDKVRIATEAISVRSMPVIDISYFVLGL